LKHGILETLNVDFKVTRKKRRREKKDSVKNDMEPQVNTDEHRKDTRKILVFILCLPVLIRGYLSYKIIEFSVFPWLNLTILKIW
jgi:hypothetical protein